MGNLTRTEELFRTAVLGTGVWLQAPSSAVSDLRPVYNLTGGIHAWDYEVVKGTTEDKLITGGEETFDVLIVALMLERVHLISTQKQRMVKDEKAAQIFQRLVAMEDTHLQRLYIRYRQLLCGMKSLLGAADELPSLDQLKAELSTAYMGVPR